MDRYTYTRIHPLSHTHTHTHAHGGEKLALLTVEPYHRSISCTHWIRSWSQQNQAHVSIFPLDDSLPVTNTLCTSAWRIFVQNRADSWLAQVFETTLCITQGLPLTSPVGPIVLCELVWRGRQFVHNLSQIVFRIFLFSRIWSSAQDHAQLVILLNLVGFLFKSDRICQNWNDLYWRCTSFEKAFRRGRPFNILHDS